MPWRLPIRRGCPSAAQTADAEIGAATAQLVGWIRVPANVGESAHKAVARLVDGCHVVINDAVVEKLGPLTEQARPRQISNNHDQ